MPIYEFRCEQCGARFEALVELGATSARCRECGAERSVRLLSAQATPPHLVLTPREARKQERRNAKLREATKSNLEATRRKARARSGRSGDGR
jgi:putative FmdB family regulatory protein